MSQPAYQPLDPDIIKTLKAARNQILTATANPLKVKDKQESTSAPSVSATQKSSRGSVEILAMGQTRSAARDKFAEEFVQKLTSIEQEKAAIDEEMAKVEKLWSSLAERKKQLEGRREDLVQVHNKIIELDKEVDNILNSRIK